MKEVPFSIMNTKNKTIKDMINKLEKLKGKTKLEFHQDFIKYYDAMNYLRTSGNLHFEEDPFSINAKNVAFIMHEALLRKLFPTKPQSKKKNINYFDLYYTIILNLSNEGEN